MTLVSKIVLSAAISVAIPSVLALGLIASQGPVADFRAQDEGLNFAALAPDARDQPLQEMTLSDGTVQAFRRWDSGVADAPLVVALHGSGWHGAQFNTLGRALSGQGIDVIAPDLRGHGPNPQRRGDVDYIGQFEDDLAQLIAAQARSGQQVVMLGHSSGGGLAIRFAGGVHGALLDRAILLAPFVQHNAPTQRENSGGWARVMTRRIIGLSMLNMVGVRALNHLPIIQFAFPSSVLDGAQGHTATRAYSFRLNASYAPRSNWQADIAALPPFLLIAGARDEAFHADRYQPSFAPLNAQGRFELIEGAQHLDVVDHPETLASIVGFVRGDTP